MSTDFLNEDFLLKSDVAKTLYHDYAEKAPIVDYHCHISPEEIYKDKHFDDIAEVWLGGDHYKWRVMRAAGISEKYITGNSSPYEKFEKYAELMPYLIGNPLYHWSHLELKRYFGIDEPLSIKNARQVWEQCNEKLKDYSARKFIEASNVKALCTTDDPVDSLEWHKKLKKDNGFSCKVLPAFRPDNALAIESEIFADYIKKLEKASGSSIKNIEGLKKALSKRLDLFKELGCVASDHGITEIPYRMKKDPEKVFKQALAGEKISAEQAESYRTYMMLFLAGEYSKRDIVMQIHYGAARNVNTSAFKVHGKDTGFDGIRGYQERIGEALAVLLDIMNEKSALPKMVVYSLNPLDNKQIAVALGCFQSEKMKCKLQHGSAWWFNDTKAGMEEQIKGLAEVSVLPYFIGMLTDSRSFISYTRHEYFRRVLCNVIGTWVEDGEYPCDMEFLGKMVEDISYNNCVNYFGFPVK